MKGRMPYLWWNNAYEGVFPVACLIIFIAPITLVRKCMFWAVSDTGGTEAKTRPHLPTIDAGSRISWRGAGWLPGEVHKLPSEQLEYRTHGYFTSTNNSLGGGRALKTTNTQITSGTCSLSLSLSTSSCDSHFCGGVTSMVRIVSYTSRLNKQQQEKGKVMSRKYTVWALSGSRLEETNCKQPFLRWLGEIMGLIFLNFIAK